MSQTARPDIPQVADELTMLTAFLDWMRATLRMKAGDLDAEQLQRRLEPSTMTLGGMVTHLALGRELVVRRDLPRRAARRAVGVARLEGRPRRGVDGRRRR